MPAPVIETYLRLPNGDPYVPMSHQRAFHTSRAKYRGWIAGMGNGKSLSCAIESLVTALLYPRSHNAVVRFDQSRLKDSTWRMLMQTIEASKLQPIVKRTITSPAELVVEFTNGSVLRGMNGHDWKKFGSYTFDSFFIDECAEFPNADALDQLCGRLRGDVGPLRGWICGLANGHDYAWQRFVRDKLADHEFFGGNSWQNPFNPEGYADNLKSLYGKEKSLLLLMGSFDVVEGRIFEMFDPRLHCVRHRALPKQWPRYTGIDPGWDDPTAMVRVAVDAEGNLVVEDAWERPHMTTEQWSAHILGLNSNPPPEFYIIDCAADRNIGQGISVLETARQCGLSPIRPGTHDVPQQISRLRSLLTPDPNRPFPSWHPRHGERGSPRLFIKENLSRFLWQMANYRWKRQGAAASMSNPQPYHDDADMVSCIRYLSDQHLSPALGTAPAPLSDWWQSLIGPDLDERPRFASLSGRHPTL